jgi:hypothetical protein
MDGEVAARHWDGAGACRKIQTISKAKSRLTRTSVGFGGFFVLKSIQRTHHRCHIFTHHNRAIRA